MQNRQNNGVGFFGLAVSSWSNSQRGPGVRNNGWFGRRVSSWCVSPRGPGATSRNQNRVVKKHHWAGMTFSPGKFGEDLCTQSCTKLGAN